MLTRFITIIALFFLPLFAKAQCWVNISYQVNCLSVQFAGIVQPGPSAGGNFYWWFNDNNNSSTLQNPSYTFSGPGTYMVCLSYWDSTSQCNDSACVSITVAPCGCFADFVAYDSLNNVSFVSSTTAPQPALYFWDFGDGNYSSQQNPNHTYLSSGTYLVCLTVYDSMQNFCDSTCHYVTVIGSGGCMADFTSLDSMGYVFFLATSTLGSGGLYYWDFGDGNYSTQCNPSHVYANAGTYTVCLTVFDSMQNFCDSTCHTIQVSTVGIAQDEFLQSLNAAPNPADGSIMISYNAINSGVCTITFFDATGRLASEKSVSHSSGINRTEVNTATLPQGNYLVKIAVNGNVGWTRIAITHQ
jgi:PKD repeat protein